MSRVNGDDRVESGPDRRLAVVAIVGGLFALAASLAGLVAGFVSNSLRRSPRRAWIRVGTAEELDPESYRRFVLRTEHRDSWRRKQKSVVVFVKDLYPADPRALLAVCSHLGCLVRWEKEASEFHCPCHGGVYDDEGRVVAGPPPSDLRQMEVKIDGEGVLYVRMPEGRAA